MSISYLFLIPDYTRTSAGIRINHRLIHLLNERGYRAYSSTSKVNSEWNELIATWKIFQEIKYNGVVFYPEIVPGNPVGAKRVIRYVCNVPGLLGGEKTYDPRELVFAYNDFLKEYAPAGNILEVPSIETELFNNDDPQPRNGGCFYVGKARLSGYMPIPQVNVLVEIARSFEGANPTPEGWPVTRLDLARLLRTSEVFYCYDNFTALLDEARLCGCPTVVIYPGPDAKQRYLDNGKSIDGLAFGMSDDELERARATVCQYSAWYLRSISGFDTQFNHFIELTQNRNSYTEAK